MKKGMNVRIDKDNRITQVIIWKLGRKDSTINNITVYQPTKSSAERALDLAKRILNIKRG